MENRKNNNNVIPKIIHYCWFGGKSKPDDFLAFLDTWKKYNPGYEIKEWNESNFDICVNDYCREAYLSGNFAHVSDVCRIVVLYKYGGVYLDTDVEVCASFDPYMKLDSFLGAEGVNVGTAVIGSRPGAKWLEAFIGYYGKRHFINYWGHPVRTPNTKILTRRVLPTLMMEDWPTIFPKDYFCGKDISSGEMVRTENTVAIHHFSASWRKKKTLSDKISVILNGLRIRHIQKTTTINENIVDNIDIQ